MHAILSSFDKYDFYIVVFSVLATLGLVSWMKRGSQISNYDHFWQNLDKFMIVGLFLTSIFIVLHMTHHAADNSSMQSMWDIVKQLLSALLAILGAKAFQKRSSDGNGNGNGSTVTTGTVSSTTVVQQEIKPKDDAGAAATSDLKKE